MNNKSQLNKNKDLNFLKLYLQKYSLIKLKTFLNIQKQTQNYHKILRQKTISYVQFLIDNN